MATGGSDVTLSRKSTVANDRPAPASAPSPSEAETVFGGPQPGGNPPELPPPPLPPPLPAFEAATVAQAAQNRPFEAAPPPYTPPAGYVAPVGVDPSVVPSAPAEAGKNRISSCSLPSAGPWFSCCSSRWQFWLTFSCFDERARHSLLRWRRLVVSPPTRQQPPHEALCA